jgi:hypothetical protein
MRRFLSVKTPSSTFMKFLLLLLVLAIRPIFNFAATPPFSDMADWGPTTFSLGGASSASASDHDSFLNNPAGLVYYERKYSLGGYWLNAPRDQTSFSASTIDGNKGALVSGFHFSSTEFGMAKRYSYTLGFAYRTPYGSAGVSTEALDFSGVSAGKGWHFTGTAGILVPVAYRISLGASVKSLVDREQNSQIPPSVKLAIMYSVPETLRVAFDADRRFSIPDQDWNYSVGGDYLFNEYLNVRGGYHWNNSTDYSFWSTGLGIVAPKVDIIGFYMKTTSGPKSTGFGVNTQLKF